ncbi:MAG: hypothetical protein IK096_07855 [Lachnospiraceae bacterium]|nr:hypothetical protein [Lachnospiraceae bacterium]
MIFLRRWKSVIFRVLFVLGLLTIVLWVSVHTLRPLPPDAPEETGETAEEIAEEEPEPEPEEPVVTGEVSVDPVFVRQVEEIRAAGNIPRIAAPVDSLPLREGRTPRQRN